MLRSNPCSPHGFPQKRPPSIAHSPLKIASPLSLLLLRLLEACAGLVPLLKKRRVPLACVQKPFDLRLLLVQLHQHLLKSRNLRLVGALLLRRRGEGIPKPLRFLPLES